MLPGNLFWSLLVECVGLGWIVLVRSAKTNSSILVILCSFCCPWRETDSFTMQLFLRKHWKVVIWTVPNEPFSWVWIMEQVLGDWSGSRGPITSNRCNFMKVFTIVATQTQQFSLLQGFPCHFYPKAASVSKSYLLNLVTTSFRSFHLYIFRPVSATEIIILKWHQ